MISFFVCCFALPLADRKTYLDSEQRLSGLLSSIIESSNKAHEIVHGEIGEFACDIPASDSPSGRKIHNTRCLGIILTPSLGHVSSDSSCATKIARFVKVMSPKSDEGISMWPPVSSFKKILQIVSFSCFSAGKNEASSTIRV